MEESNKHNRRIDEAMADQDASFLHGAPVDSRLREDLRTEGNGPRPGQASANAEVAGREPGTSEGLSAEEVAERAELATYIEGHVFPGDKHALLRSATDENAPQPIISLLKKLPEGQTFEHFQEVWESVSQ